MDARAATTRSTIRILEQELAETKEALLATKQRATDAVEKVARPRRH